MIQKSSVFRVGIIIGSIMFCAASVSWYLTARPYETRVTFFDVGQGDAILISSGTHQILIDGGGDGSRLLEHMGRSMPLWDRTVDVVIATHPDTDHIAAQIALLQHYQVHTIIATHASATSPAARAWKDAVTVAHVPIIFAHAGLRIALAQENPNVGTISFLLPRTTEMITAETETNEASIVVVVTVGATRFLLTGDLPITEEDAIPSGAVTVLKVGHHGSASSTGEDLLVRTMPHEAVISVGMANTYGHPASAVLERLSRHNVAIFRTDRDGTIVYRCAHNATVCTHMYPRKK